MPIQVCGINHKTASLELREKLAFSPQGLQQSLSSIQHELGIVEVAILSTCNRTEVYFCKAEPDAIITWLSRHQGVNPDHLQKHLYSYRGAEAVTHLLRVASGLDSMVVGEAQIFSQVKQAYQGALQAGTVGQTLQRLFQMVFSATKRVRSKTGLGAHSLSIVYCAFQLAQHIFEKIEEKQVLVIGAGETSSLVLRYLKVYGVKRVLIANRNNQRANELAELYHAEAISLAQVPDYIGHCDLIFTATASTLPLLGKGMFERAMKQRKHRPLLVLDLAVPRDVEPEVADIADVYLYTVDDLQAIVQDNLKHRQFAAEQAEQLIELEAEEFRRWQQSLSAVETICDYRAKIKELTQQELKKANLRLQHEDLSSEQVLQHFAYRLSQRLMHLPSVKLREAGAEGHDDVVALVRWLYELD